MGDQTVEKQWQQHHLHLHRTNLIEIHGWGVIMTGPCVTTGSYEIDWLLALRLLTGPYDEAYLMWLFLGCDTQP